MAAAQRMLLIKPTSPTELAFPLGLAALVPGLKGRNWRVTGCDVDFGELPLVLREVANGTYSAAGIGLSSFQVADTSSIARRLKALAPDMPILVGGPHATLFPGRCLADTGADLAVRGDGENLLLEALNFLMEGGRPPAGVAHRVGDSIEIVGEPRYEPDLDALAPPDRGLFPLPRYGLGYRSVAYPYATMVSSRGCPHHCPYCAAPALRPGGLAVRSVGLVVDEMERLVEDHAVRDVHFEDDAFAAHHPRVRALCEELVRRGFRYPWEVVNGVRTRDVEVSLLPLMARAGCRRIALGVDSFKVRPTASHTHGSEEEDMEALRGIVRAARRSGIETTAYFVLGLPGAEPSRDEASVRLSRRIGFDLAHYSPYEEVPGSQLSEVHDRAKLDARSTRILAAKAYRRFYFRPAPLARLAREAALHPRLMPGVSSKVLKRLF